MKNAFKVGFGFAFGMHMFRICETITVKLIDKYLKKKFDEDGNFSEYIRVTSPELYVKYRKETKETTFD